MSMLAKPRYRVALLTDKQDGPTQGRWIHALSDQDAIDEAELYFGMVNSIPGLPIKFTRWVVRVLPGPRQLPRILATGGTNDPA